MFSPLVSSPSAADDGEELASSAGSSSKAGHYQPMTSTADADDDALERDGRPTLALELSSLRTNGLGGAGSRASSGRSSSGSCSGDELESGGGMNNALISGEHPSEATKQSPEPSSHAAAAVAPSVSSTSRSGGAASSLSFEVLSLRLRNLMMEDASETAEEELEMTDYDNPEDHILERRLDEDGSSSSGSRVCGCTGACARLLNAMGVTGRAWRKLRLTALRMVITILIGVCIGLTGFAVSRSVTGLVDGNLHILNSLMGKDRPAAAFFTILLLSCLYTGIAALFVTFGSWQTRGSGVGRLNAYLSGMSSSKFLALKTLFVKILGLVLTVAAGIKQGMEGPFIHIGAMIGLHISRLVCWTLNLLFGRWGVSKYTQILLGVVDERMFISGGAAAGFSVAFNAPIAGVLYVQDGAFAYWQGEYTIRAFLCTMTAVTTLNMCFKDGDTLPSRGLIDLGNFLPTTITLQEFWGFFVLGLLGGVMGIAFTKANVAIEKFRQKHLATLRLPNLLDVLACTVVTVLLSFILPFMLGCHSRYDDWCTLNPDRCLQFQCGPSRYSDLATFFFTLPEETIRILFDRTPTSEAQIPYQTLLLFCIIYAILACISYGMAVPGGLFIPSIVIGASYGRLVGLAVQAILPGGDTTSGGTYLGINPGVYAVLGSASMLGGITRMTLPISVMMIEITSDAQFLIPIMLVVLLAKVVADAGCGSLYAEHLKLDGLVMVFGDRPPGALKKLRARDVMSARAVRKLDVVDSVQSAWAAIRETRHNAFPVTDSGVATLRSILQRRRQQQQQAAATAGLTQRRQAVANANRQAQQDASPAAAASSSAAAAGSIPSATASSPPVADLSSGGPGSFLGLIQRRHLVYVLTSMPCFETSQAARDSEPMTALPYEMAVASAGFPTPAPNGIVANGNATLERRSDSTAGGSDDAAGLEVVPLGSSSSAPPPPIDAMSRRQHSVSHAQMYNVAASLSGEAVGPTLLNEEGASASASFVEWIARQATTVDQDMDNVAHGVAPQQAAPTQTAVLRSPRPVSPHEAHAAAAQLPPSPTAPEAGSHGQGHGHGHHVVPSALGHDLTVDESMLDHFVNLSPFIDQGAYTVSENISARRVWSLFRSLGMRHIVVLNHQHQPVGIITKRDLMRFAVTQ